MSNDPDFSKMSKAELTHFITQYSSTHIYYKLALSELSKREILISEIPNFPEDVLKKIIEAPDVPDQRGRGHGLINAAIKTAAAAELRRREVEINIKSISSAQEKKWHEKPYGLIIIGLIIAILTYFAIELFSSLKDKM